MIGQFILFFFDMGCFTDENADIFQSTFKFAILTNSKGEIIYSQYSDETVAQKENDLEKTLQEYLSKKEEVKILNKILNFKQSYMIDT